VAGYFHILLYPGFQKILPGKMHPCCYTGSSITLSNFFFVTSLQGSKPGSRSSKTWIFQITYSEMNKSGPIIIIEDDMDDQEMLTEVFKELEYSNKVIFFGDSLKALAYLTDSDIEPFLVLSDINMPKLNGMELREKVHNNEDLRLKSIPYLFFSTTAEQKHVIDAYSRSIQGFFVKPTNYEKLKTVIAKIVAYWQECESPNYIKNAQ
jgi:CheY-like chemotaxis protein